MEVDDLPDSAAEAAATRATQPEVQGVGSAPQAATDPLAALESEAQNAYADGDLGRALALYVELGDRHELAAERARVRIVAAWLAWQTQDFQSAISYLESALYEQPQAPFQTDLYAPEFVASFQDALANALARRRRTASETINRAAALLRNGQLPEARHLLDAALALTPDDPDALYNLALVDLRQGHDDAALAGFQRVLALERGNPEGLSAALKSQALNNSAVVYFSRGDYADAESALSEALELDPDDAKAWLNLGLTRRKLSRDGDAYDALRRARNLAPSDVAITRALAMAEIDRANWVAAVALLIETTQSRPDDADLRLQLGRAQLGLGNQVGAIESFGRALELDANGQAGVAAPANQLLADTLRQQGDFAGAAIAAERAVALQPGDASAWLRLGLARYQKSDLPGAIEALRRAETVAPGRADVAHNLGMVQMAQRDYAAAEESFRRSLERDPNNAETRAALDRLSARQTEIARAALARGDLGAMLAVADYAPLKIRGLRIDGVPPGSVAHRIGLQAGDLVLRVDGRTVETLEELRKRLVGKKTPPLIELLRQGSPVTIQAKIN